MNYLPFLIFAVLLVGMLALAGRNRRRVAAAETERSQRIGVGSDVMTTSGLHGTVVAVNGDGTVALSIAAGVEVRWELAALRDVTELPSRYIHDGDVHDDSSVPADNGRPAVDLGKPRPGDERSGADPA